MGQARIDTTTGKGHDCLSSLPDSLQGHFFGGSAIGSGSASSSHGGDVIPSTEEEKWAKQQEEQ